MEINDAIMPLEREQIPPRRIVLETMIEHHAKTLLEPLLHAAGLNERVIHVTLPNNPFTGTVTPSHVLRDGWKITRDSAPSVYGTRDFTFDVTVRISFESSTSTRNFADFFLDHDIEFMEDNFEDDIGKIIKWKLDDGDATLAVMNPERFSRMEFINHNLDFINCEKRLFDVERSTINFAFLGTGIFLSEVEVNTKREQQKERRAKEPNRREGREEKKRLKEEKEKHRRSAILERMLVGESVALLVPLLLATGLDSNTAHLDVGKEWSIERSTTPAEGRDYTFNATVKIALSDKLLKRTSEALEKFSTFFLEHDLFYLKANFKEKPRRITGEIIRWELDHDGDVMEFITKRFVDQHRTDQEAERHGKENLIAQKRREEEELRAHKRQQEEEAMLIHTQYVAIRRHIPFEMDTVTCYHLLSWMVDKGSAGLFEPLLKLAHREPTDVTSIDFPPYSQKGEVGHREDSGPVFTAARWPDGTLKVTFSVRIKVRFSHAPKKLQNFAEFFEQNNLARVKDILHDKMGEKTEWKLDQFHKGDVTVVVKNPKLELAPAKSPVFDRKNSTVTFIFLDTGDPIRLKTQPERDDGGHQDDIDPHTPSSRHELLSPGKVFRRGARKSPLSRFPGSYERYRKRVANACMKLTSRWD